MKKIFIYTCAFNKEKNANEIAQSRVIKLLNKLADSEVKFIYVNVFSAKGAFVKKTFKIIRDILGLLSPFCCGKIWFYPTMPLFPITEQKWKTAKLVYGVMNKIDKIFGIRHSVFLFDIPVEQTADLKIHNMSDKDIKRIKAFEKMVIENADYVIDSGNFSALCPKSDAAIIKTKFLPCLIDNTILTKKEFSDEVRIFYAGDMRRKYESNFLKHTIKNVNSKNIIAKFVLCGYALEDFKAFCNTREDVEFHGYVPNEVCDELAAGCDFGLMIYPPEGYYNYVSTTKFVSYIRSGLPILSLDAAVIKENINYYKVGEAVEDKVFINTIIKWVSEKRYNKYKENAEALRNKIISGKVFECLKELWR